MKQILIPKITDFSSWDKAAKIDDFSYPWQKEKAPKTIFYSYYDDNYIHFRFVAFGPKPLIFVRNNNKLEVIESERVEIFFRSDDKMNPYYCLEMDPLGRVLDYKAELYRKFQRNWQWPESLMIKTTITNENYSLQGRISLNVLKELNLLKDKEIQIGLYRGHCTKIKKKKGFIKWISWIDSKTKTPDFHVPSSFGLLKLSRLES